MKSWFHEAKLAVDLSLDFYFSIEILSLHLIFIQTDYQAEIF